MHYFLFSPLFPSSNWIQQNIKHYLFWFDSILNSAQVKVIPQNERQVKTSCCDFPTETNSEVEAGWFKKDTYTSSFVEHDDFTDIQNWKLI